MYTGHCGLRRFVKCKADRNRGRMRTRRAEVASGIVLVGMV